LRNSNAKRLCEDFKRTKSDIAFLAFNGADVRAMETTKSREFFLRETLGAAVITDICRKGLREAPARFSEICRSHDPFAWPNLTNDECCQYESSESTDNE
jgi:hypothetical protein